MSRLVLASSLLFLAACSVDAPPPNTLCAYCLNDSQCAGTPCFQDVSGSRFCGYPCGQCPTGYSCQTVMGTTGLQQTCFPNNEACVPSTAGGDTPDQSMPESTSDLSFPPGAHDLATAPRDFGGIPAGGQVGPQGGSVDRLFFGFTGDTRPAQCGDVYPTMVIQNIYTLMKGDGVQFAIDQGDHMFNCGSGQSAFSGAKQQMNDYVTAAALLGKTVFMTMGNHECTGESQSLCALSSYGGNPNYTAFMDALAPVSSKPYYRFDVMTKTGLAVFLVVADDTWDATQQQWLTTQLTDADTRAKYTFVSKHHPDGNTDHPEFQQIYNLVRQHKYTLFLTGHSHLFKRQSSDPRALVIGCGGAPLAGGTFWGYGTALQGSDDRIYVTVHDQATRNVVQAFDVAPQ
jgi:hypothetical protein